LDVPLDPVGVVQAAQTARFLKANYAIDAIYASDLSRAVDTAKRTAQMFELPIHTRIDLRENNLGEWQGMLIDDVHAQYRELVDQLRAAPGLHRFPGGENHAEVRMRAARAMEEIAQTHPDGTVAVFTHGALIRAICGLWLGIPLERVQELPIVPNSCVTVAQWEVGRVTLRQMGDTSHLNAEPMENHAE
jgi:broad specificity phosphatase PhoE